jgi:hypothetical protein
VCYLAAEINLLKSTLHVEKEKAIKEKNEMASSHQAQLAVQRQEHAAEVEQLKEKIGSLEQSLATHNEATDQEVVMHLEAARDLWGREYTRRHPSDDISFMKLIDVINYVEKQTETEKNVDK